MLKLQEVFCNMFPQNSTENYVENIVDREENRHQATTAADIKKITHLSINEWIRTGRTQTLRAVEMEKKHEPRF